MGMTTSSSTKSTTSAAGSETRGRQEVEDFLASVRRLGFYRRCLCGALLCVAAAWGSVLGCLLLPYKIYAPFVLALLCGGVMGWQLGFWGRKWRLFARRRSSQKSHKANVAEWNSEALGQHMECLHPQTATSFWSWSSASDKDALELKKVWQQEGRQLKACLHKDIRKKLGVLVLAVIGQAVVIGVFPEQIYRSSRHALSWLPGWHYPNTLTIKKGVAQIDRPSQYELRPSSSPVEVQVLPGNRLQLKIRSHPYADQVAVILTQKGLDVLGDDADSEKMVQSFRTQKNSSYGEGSFAQVLHELSFRVEGDVSLWVPRISRAYPLADVKVMQQPLPQVGLMLQNPGGLKDPWPDEESLFFKVAAASEEPLTELRWVIQTQHGEVREPLAAVLARRQKRVIHQSSLNLARYLRSSREHMHIFAEAVARNADGRELVGRSDALEITVISSYGRYQQTLEILGQVRKGLWQWLEGGIEKKEQLLSDVQKSYELSASTPFFDSDDREFLAHLWQSAQSSEFLESSDMHRELLSELHSFLEEHEFLDDRERDRDFFVASRALSGLLRTSIDAQNIAAADVEEAAERMQHFLEQRRQRWQERVSRMTERFRPESATAVVEKRGLSRRWDELMARIHEYGNAEESSAQQKAWADSMADLSEITTRYRRWIEELESAEDKRREEMSRQHVRSLGQAEQHLRLLQKEQDHIAQSLDRPQGQNLTALRASWPQTQQRQEANLSELQQLIQNLRAVPYLSTARIEGAAQAMEEVVRAGAEERFSGAEDAADLAARLLRESRQQVSNQRQHRSQQASGARSRKRVSGDGYFGGGVVYLPLDKSHTVSERYREEVLSGIGVPPADEKKRAVMNRYLREMVR